MQVPLLKLSFSNWRQILRQNFTRVDQLADFLELTANQRDQLLSRPAFIFNLPLRLAQKMEKGNLEDPLLKQFVPTLKEEEKQVGFVADPVKDATFRQESKLLRKYEGRVLLLCTSACAMHCRFCFRQNFNYDGKDKIFSAELKAIAADFSIQEVILSGGDPLSLSEDLLEFVLEQIAKIPHIKRIRFHTRFPIGIPERIDHTFLNLIARLDKQIWFVIHTNHPRELDQDVLHYLKKLQRIGCTLLSQSVLLKEVNDNVSTLKELCERLIDHGILPYYLHQLDRVQGAAHFEVGEEKGRYLIQELTKILPGYAIPKYVCEIAGEASKTPLIF
jgi:EF-P beta-lysylation protein EpmB